jgi:hypothetical protein
LLGIYKPTSNLRQEKPAFWAFDLENALFDKRGATRGFTEGKFGLQGLRARTYEGRITLKMGGAGVIQSGLPSTANKERRGLKVQTAKILKFCRGEQSFWINTRLAESLYKLLFLGGSGENPKKKRERKIGHGVTGIQGAGLRKRYGDVRDVVSALSVSGPALQG